MSPFVATHRIDAGTASACRLCTWFVAEISGGHFHVVLVCPTGHTPHVLQICHHHSCRRFPEQVSGTQSFLSHACDRRAKAKRTVGKGLPTLGRDGGRGLRSRQNTSKKGRKGNTTLKKNQTAMFAVDSSTTLLSPTVVWMRLAYIIVDSLFLRQVCAGLLKLRLEQAGLH